MVPIPETIHNMGLKLCMPNLCKGEQDMEEQLGQRVDVISRSFNSSLLSLCVQGIFEFEEAITDISSYNKACANALLSSNPLFSCIMVIVLLLLLIQFRFFLM
jgi:hypothetical protein